jgi:hypothetical protein
MRAPEPPFPPPPHTQKHTRTLSCDWVLREYEWARAHERTVHVSVLFVADGEPKAAGVADCGGVLVDGVVAGPGGLAGAHGQKAQGAHGHLRSHPKQGAGRAGRAGRAGGGETGGGRGVGWAGLWAGGWCSVLGEGRAGAGGRAGDVPGLSLPSLCSHEGCRAREGGGYVHPCQGP